MNLHKQLLTENDCYKRGEVITPGGGVLHSTGAENPNLRRYVGPDDGLLGRTSSHNWNRPGVGACVHAFIGLLADGSVATYQTLPWTMRGWHCGRGEKGSANDTHLSVEICEDGLEDPVYFAAVYREAVELFAFWGRLFGWNPLEDGVVLCHCEAHKQGIASNHADVMHWFSRHGKTMDDFRADVAREMEEDMLTEQEIRKIVRSEMEQIDEERAAKPASDWASELLEEAKAEGITDGSRPQSYATRQEVALMVYAAI
mgnify:CR=1 FL=1